MLLALKWSTTVFALIVFACSTMPTAPGEANLVLIVTDADLAFCVSETNRYRAMAGQSPLNRSSSLEERARLAAENDHQTGNPHGYLQSHPLTFGAENEVVRWPVAAHDTVRGVMTNAISTYWQEGSAGRRYQNITGSHATVGCGLAVSNNSLTFVQDFQ
jgi:hypothetical protein